MFKANKKGFIDLEMNNKPPAILLDLPSVCVERGVSSSHRMSSSTIIRLSRGPLRSLWKILSTTLGCDFPCHKCETFSFASLFISSLCPKPWDDYLVQHMEWMLFSWLVYLLFNYSPHSPHIQLDTQQHYQTILQLITGDLSAFMAASLSDRIAMVGPVHRLTRLLSKHCLTV